MKPLILFSLIMLGMLRQVQSNNVPALSPHNLGASGGTISGVGLAYRKWLPNGWGFQAAGFPIFSKSASLTSANVNFGFLTLKSFFNTDKTPSGKSGFFSANVYGYGGGSLWYDYSKEENGYFRASPEVDGDAKTVYNVNEDIRYSLGSGFGFEIGIWRIKWNLLIGLGAYYVDEIVQIYDDPEDSYGLIPSAETALFFGF